MSRALPLCPQGHPSRMALDRAWLAPEGASHGATRTHLGSCAPCQAYLSELDGCADAFAVGAPSSVLDALADAAAAPAHSWADWLSGWLPRPAPALATLALIMVIGLSAWRALDPGRGTGVEGWSAKIAVGLEVIGQREGRTFRATEGEALRDGDRLRFRVAPPHDGYLMVVLVDADGHVTRLHPARGGAAARAPARAALLPGSARLDDSVGVERLFVLFSREPFDEADLRPAVDEALARGAGVRSLERLPLDLVQTSFWFIKPGREP
jgi:hypothetical protein